MERLQKVLAQAGVASRRAAEQLILDGRVTVNGTVVTKLGTQVDPDRDAIKVDGRRIRRPPPQRTYLALNKPRGVLTTLSDPEGRPTIVDLIPRGSPRVFPVGRLDFNSEGLILLTDDGDLARFLTQPRSRVEKVYRVKIQGIPETRSLERIRRGISIEGRKTAPARVRIYRHGKNPWLEITVTEGRKHLVRRLLEAVGHRVTKLRRIRIGPLDLGDLPPGKARRLTDDEISRLRGAGSRQPGSRPRSGGHRP
jgi:pseudouridine synthase